MIVLRLTNVAGVVRNWEFIHEGIREIQKFLKYNVSFDTYRRIICHLVRQPDAYVAVVFSNDHEPLGFAVAHDCTPLFASDVEYEVSILYHRRDESSATEALQHDFETFLRSKNCKRYYLTTRRDSGSAIRCFQSAKFGLQRAYTVFKKDLI